MEKHALKLVVLDRDGVINHDSDAFIKSPKEWRPIPGSLEAIARLNRAGYRVVVCTYQSGLARGLFDIRTLNAIHQTMHDAAQQAGAVIDAIFFCPHSAEDDCDCRKPRPGMLQAIALRYGVNLKNVPVAGDSLRDLQAAVAMGCQPCLVLTGKGRQTLQKGGLPANTEVYPNLSQMVDAVLANAVASTPEHPRP